MTHLNFSVEQHGGIYISLSGNVSTFFSSSNIEKIQKRLKYVRNKHTHKHKYATHFLETTGEHLLLNTTYNTAVFFLIIEVIKYDCLVEPWSLFRAALISKVVSSA